MLRNDDCRVPAWALWALFVAFSVVSLSGIGSFGMQDNNEGLYATIAKEMLASGEWVVPHLNGVPYLEKPPLLYWMVAASLALFGHSEVAVRLVPVFFMGLTVLGLLRLFAQMGRPRTGCMAAAMLLSTGGFVVMSRSLLFDVPMTAFLVWSLVFFHGYLTGQGRRMLLLFYACLALAVMAKGPTALVLGGGCALIAAAVLERSARAVLRVFDPLGILLFFVIAAPWHILAELRHPGFAHFYFVNEHVLRFLNLRQPQDYYHGPFYYYLLRVPMYLGLWTCFLPLLWFLLRPAGSSAEAGVANAVRADADQTPRAGAGSAAGALRAERCGRILLWVAVLLPLVFFSVSRAKANYYWLPSIPPLVGLLALAWPAAANGLRGLNWVKWVMYALAALAVAALPALLLVPHLVRIEAPWGEFVGSARVLLTVVLLALTALGGIWALRRKGALGVLVAVSVGGLLPWLVAPRALSLAEPDISNREVAVFLNAQAGGSVIFLHDYEYMSSLGFYLKSPIPIVDCTSNDLYYAFHLERYPQIFIGRAALQGKAHSGRVYLVLRNSMETACNSDFGPMGFRKLRSFEKLTVFASEPEPPATVVAAAAH